MDHIAVFDLDNTIYRGSVIHDLSLVLANNCIGECEFPQRLDHYRRTLEMGQDDIETHTRVILYEWAAALRGVQMEVIQRATEDFILSTHLFYPYFSACLEILRQNYRIYLVTAEPSFVARSVCNRFSLTAFGASRFSVTEGRLTGGVDFTLHSAHSKVMAMFEAIGSCSVRGSRLIVLGDSIADAEMLRAAQYAICVDPGAELRRAAQAEGWSVLSPERVPEYIRKIA